MQLRYLIVILSATALLSGCGSMKKNKKSTKTLPGTWQEQPIAIDGDSKDWPSPYPNYDSKAKIGYATSNDRRYLYITMETGDELTQLKLLRGGMTVSIDTSGGKDPQFTLKYPMENDNTEIDIPHPENSSKESAMRAGQQMTKNIRKALEQNNQMALDGFRTCDGGYMTSQTNSCGIRVKMRMDEYKEIVWEAAIPVKVLYGKDTITNEIAGKAITVCYSIPGVKRPKSASVDNVNNNVGADMNNTPGSQRNSMPRAGAVPGGRNSESPFEHMYTGTKTWKQFGLTTRSSQ